MKRIDLSVFLHFGESLGELKKAWTGMEWIEFYMLVLTPIDWLQRFIRETEGVPCPDSTSSAKRLLAILTEATKQPVNPKRAITSDEVAGVFHTTDEFLESFEREHRNLDVFTVTPKGIYDTRLLIDKTEEKFPESIRKHFSPIMLYDLRQAGRCLAFEVPTACAFHVFRLTEALALRYWEVLAKHPWPHNQRDLGRYITELEKLPGVNKDLTRRLDEIRKFERNPTIHPEHIVDLERAPILFELSTGAIYGMGDEICKLI
jgi:hypothetical protein